MMGLMMLIETLSNYQLRSRIKLMVILFLSRRRCRRLNQHNSPFPST